MRDEHATTPGRLASRRDRGDVTRSVVAEQSWFVHDLRTVEPEVVNASSSVPVTSSARIVVHSFQAMIKRE